MHIVAEPVDTRSSTFEVVTPSGLRVCGLDLDALGASQRLRTQDAEEALDLVQRGGARRRVVEMHERVGRKPASDFRRAVRGRAQFRLAPRNSIGGDAVNAITAILEREVAPAHARHQSDLARDGASAISVAIGLSTRSNPPKPPSN